MKELKSWEIATNNLASEFILKYFGGEIVTWFKNNDIADDGYEFEAVNTGYNTSETECACYGYWIGEDIGGVLDVGGYFFNLERIVEALKYNASEDHLFAFEDLEMELISLEEDFNKTLRMPINFRNFSRYIKDIEGYSDAVIAVAKGELDEKELDKFLENKNPYKNLADLEAVIKNNGLEE